MNSKQIMKSGWKEKFTILRLHGIIFCCQVTSDYNYKIVVKLELRCIYCKNFSNFIFINLVIFYVVHNILDI